jgi:hypothetical protein
LSPDTLSTIKYVYSEAPCDFRNEKNSVDYENLLKVEILISVPRYKRIWLMK